MAKLPDANSPDTSPDTSNAITLPPFIYFGFLVIGLALEYALPYPILPNMMQLVVGGIFIAAGFIIAGLSFFRFRAAGTSVHVHEPTTAIVSDGLYRYSRNPIYLAMVIVIIGIGIAVDGIWVIAMLAPTLVVVHYGVIAREERYLEAKFGEDYLAYKRKVRRWI